MFVIAAIITSIFIEQLLRAHVKLLRAYVKLLRGHVNVIACARKAIVWPILGASTSVDRLLLNSGFCGNLQSIKARFIKHCKWVVANGYRINITLFLLNCLL